MIIPVFCLVVGIKKDGRIIVFDTISSSHVYGPHIPIIGPSFMLYTLPSSRDHHIPVLDLAAAPMAQICDGQPLRGRTWV
jgi:hypothetical protein